MRDILGISLGTRLIGMAIMYDGELSNFRVRTFRGTWNDNKRRAMIAAIRKVVEQYSLTTISLKTPKHTHCTQAINELVADIRALCEELSIKLCICTIVFLKQQFNGPERSNRQQLAVSIASRYPNFQHLANLCVKEGSNKHAYHMKLFEAIACADLALRTGH